MTKNGLLPGLVMASQTYCFLKENKQTNCYLHNFIIDNANASHCSALGWRNNESWSVATTIAKDAIGLRGFIGASRNGQSTMATFNAVTGLNPFTIIAVAIAGCWCDISR